MTLLTRRHFLKSGLLAALGTSACMPPTLRMTRDAISAQSSSGNGAFGASEEFLKKFPYATMGVELHEQSRFVSVLATIDSGRYTWAAADSKLFVTQGGRLIETRGLDRDLFTTHWLAPDPLLDWQSFGSNAVHGVYRELELAAGKSRESNLQVESRFVVLGQETISVLGEQRTTAKVREVAKIRKWRWAAENTFWIDIAQPVVWRSSQCFCPETGSLQMDLLKNPTA